MHVAIVIATYNRADELRQTLEGLSRINQSPGHSFEIVVVDNKSTDHTPQVVDALIPTFPVRLRRIYEQNQGSSPARNRGIAESQGEIVAFLDDDVDVDPDWFVALIDAYQSNDVAAVGGRARLVYPVPRPSWITHHEGLLSRVEHGDEPKEVGPDDLFGLNLSVRRDWLDRVGVFRLDLGRVGKRLSSGEELDVLVRVQAAGGRLWYEPRASLGHRVPMERLSRRWFLKRAYAGALCEARGSAGETSFVWLARYSWHALRAAISIIGSSLRHGPGSAQTFAPARALATMSGHVQGTWNKLIFPHRYPVKADR
jgi:glycosyltransferase involved in cell wall biosynthesis